MDEVGEGVKPNWCKRLAWLVLIWAASVAALGVAAYVLRLVMGWAGMSS